MDDWPAESTFDLLVLLGAVLGTAAFAVKDWLVHGRGRTRGRGGKAGPAARDGGK